MKRSAGILVFRRTPELEFFLVHPGGPFWRNKDEGAWTIPKGEFTDEDPLVAARREFEEETGQSIAGEFLVLPPVRQKSGKIVYAWAVEGSVDETKLLSNTFRLEWPPRSGSYRDFPEVDRAGWFEYEAACLKINPAQIPFLAAIVQKLSAR